MITITLLDGPYADQTRTSAQVEQVGENPLGLLMEFARQNWRWRLNFSQATGDEEFWWGRAHLAATCMRALAHGRTVTFKGRVYAGLHEAGALDDAIAGCGAYVGIASDDVSGVVIRAAGTAPTA